MSDFSSGVKKYIHAQATVDVYFPVDWKDVSDVSCRQCKFFRTSSSSCALNGEVCQYPARYVGDGCPLIKVE